MLIMISLTVSSVDFVFKPEMATSGALHQVWVYSHLFSAAAAAMCLRDTNHVEGERLLQTLRWNAILAGKCTQVRAVCMSEIEIDTVEWIRWLQVHNSINISESEFVWRIPSGVMGKVLGHCRPVGWKPTCNKPMDPGRSRLQSSGDFGAQKHIWITFRYTSINHIII